jgi:hypothetical protein
MNSHTSLYIHLKGLIKNLIDGSKNSPRLNLSKLEFYMNWSTVSAVNRVVTASFCYKHIYIYIYIYI